MFGNYTLLTGKSVPILPTAFGSSLIQWSSMADTSTYTPVSGKVYQWNDKSGNNKHFTFTTAGAAYSPNFVANSQNGIAGLGFGGGGSTNLACPDIFTGLSTVTVMVVKKPNKPTPSGIEVSHGATGFYSSVGADWRRLEFSNSPFGLISMVGKGQNQCFLETFVYNGSKKTLGVNNRFYTKPQTGALGISGGLYLGTNAPNNFSCGVDILEVIVFNRALSKNELASMVDYCNSVYNFMGAEAQTPSRVRVLYLGDSNTFGASGDLGNGNPLNYPSQSQDLVGSGFYENHGVPGEQVPDMQTRATNTLIPSFDASFEKNVVAIWGGTNDLAFTAKTGAQIYTSLVNLSQSLRTAGYKTTIATIVDRNESGLRSDFNARRADLNALIKASNNTVCDGIVDLTTDPDLDTVGASTNLTFYNVDKVHVNKAGSLKVAVIASNVIKTI